MKLLAILALLSIVLLSVPPANAVMPHWAIRSITYAYSTSLPMESSFEPAVEAAIQNWRGWLPELNLTRVPFGQENITIEFYQALTVPSGNYAEYVLTTTGDIINHAIVRTASYTFARVFDVQGGVNALGHEFGHVFGLADRSGGIMGGDSAWDHLSDTAQIISPTAEQLQELHATYESIPMPEFSIPPTVFLLLLMPIILIITRKQKTINS